MVIGGWPAPTTFHEVGEFSLYGFYQQFVEGNQAIAARLTARSQTDFEWERTAVHQAAFDELMQGVKSVTYLTAIDPRQPCHL